MTGSAFYQYLLNTFERTDKETEAYQAITDAVADMSMRLISDDEAQESSALTGISSIGDFNLDLPTGFGHPIGEELLIIETGGDQDYTPAMKISKSRYDLMYPEHKVATPGNRDTSAPRHWCIFQDKIWLGPAVDKLTYQFFINYSNENLDDIVSGTADVPFSDNKHRKCLSYAAMQFLYEIMENFQEAAVWETRYLRCIDDLETVEWHKTMSTDPIQYQGL